ncbi:MAG: type II toxin-antitoxin system HicA family toxin [Deltaproteobacteria bacterium]|nr:type II toxin-antitoxin system HicA family toxin [Deltaproteobacteria bacterium]
MPISGKEMLKLYLADGWIILRQRGSHVVVGKGKLRQVIPVHGNKDLKRGLERALLRVLNAKKED